jgi:predicted alpha/beta-fold hydrolase
MRNKAHLCYSIRLLGGWESFQPGMAAGAAFSRPRMEHVATSLRTPSVDIKLLQKLSVMLLVGFLALSAVAGVFLAEATLRPGRRLESPIEEMQTRDMAGRRDAELTDAVITSKDAITLRAWSVVPRHSNGNAVILLHGLGDNHVGTTGYADLLLDRGFSVLMPDARGHGASGGDLVTYGLLESDDIHRWLDWLEQHDRPGCIYGLGESMGAAQLLQSLRSESRFCAVVAESSFANFREIGYDRIGQAFGTGPWLGRTLLRPILECAFAYSAWKYKLHFEQASPENAVAETRIPVFLIHGQNDSNIPVRHSRLIAQRNPAVVLWEVPNTDHCGAVGTNPAEFHQRLIHWFDSHTDARSRLAVQFSQ